MSVQKKTKRYRTITTGCVLCLLLACNPLLAQLSEEKDSIPKGVSEYLFSLNILKNTKTGEKTSKSVNIDNNSSLYTSLQQLVKGSSTGVYTQEPSSEPGVDQNMFIRGLSYPLINRKELMNQQPTVYLNGVPLIQDNPFILDVNAYDVNKPGPATNLFNSININTVKSIDIITDPFDLAILGPVAANGAIWVETKHAKGTFKKVTVNSSFGTALAESGTAVNATYEYRFREPFYKKYASAQDYADMPRFLKDTTNPDYYGPAKWQDLYYNNGLVYNFDAAITGGARKSNYFFFTGVTQTGGITDNTRLLRFTQAIQLNSKIKDWLMASGNINYSKITRKRNRNLQDRFAEQQYIPSLESPISPTFDIYNYYKGEFDEAIDNNNANALQGYISLSARPIFKNLLIVSRGGFDYNEGSRSTFWPTTLLEGNNFYSNFYVSNRRLFFTNNISYQLDFESHRTMKIDFGQSLYSDQHAYTYLYAFNTPSNKVKTNVGGGSTRPTLFATLMNSNLISVYGNVDYNLSKSISISALIRRDGSSELPPNVRWFNSYGASVGYKVLQNQIGVINNLEINASWSRIGKLLNEERFSKGAQYVSNVGWGVVNYLGTYNSISALVRPYASGWIGYDVSWQYVENGNLSVAIGLLNNKLNLKIDLYNRENKNMLAVVPVSGVWGYAGELASGVWINNKGAELSISAEILKTASLKWYSNLYVSYNTNQLKALPKGQTEIVYNNGDTKLKVGERIDAFWIFSNRGVFNSSAEIPVNSSGKVFNYRGLPFAAGDAKWADINNDNTINDDDKILRGNYIPKINGGFNNTVSYKNCQLDFQLYFVLGRKVLNEYARARLDFINSSSSGDINSVKEITFWEKRMDFGNYPIYNPWSTKLPYQLQQDLYLEDASFLKLRSLSFSYYIKSDKPGKFLDTGAPRNRRIYIMANNLFAISKLKGGDPELAGYNGIFDGRGIPMPKTIAIGFELDL